MKNYGDKMTVLCVAGALLLASVAWSQTPATPKGQAVVNSVTVTATVTKIDLKTREVTIKTDDGQVSSFVAGTAVQNLAQVKKGDLVTATYTEALAYEVKKGGKAVPAGQVDAGAVAAPGAKPAGVVAEQTTMTVKITAIDPNVPSVTFQGPEGRTRTIKISDRSRLQGVSVGDTVDLTYTEAVAMTVTKAAKK